MIYHPHCWVIVEIDTPDYGKVHKVLASWYGGYTEPDYWRMNSGITIVTEAEDDYAVAGYSKNVYNLRKDSEKFSSLSAAVFASSVKTVESAGGTMKVITMKEYLDEANSVSD